MLEQKEPVIQKKTGDDANDYYYSGNKTWLSIREKVRDTVLAGLSTVTNAAISATDSVLSSLGKLQAQVTDVKSKTDLTGTSDPTTETEGNIGQRYINTSNGKWWTLKSIENDAYNWVEGAYTATYATSSATANGLTQSAFKSILLAAHPVGSLYWSSEPTPPEKLFGGSWIPITDTFIMAAGSRFSAGTSGGESSINLQHVHTTGNFTLGITHIPLHRHVEAENLMYDANTTTGTHFGALLYDYTNRYVAKKTANSYVGGGQPHNHGNTGNALSTAQSIIPPYEAYYCWRRTA